MKRLMGLVLTVVLVFGLAAPAFTVGAATGAPSGDAIGSGNGTQPVTAGQAQAGVQSTTPQSEQPEALAASQYADMAKEMARVMNVEREKRNLSAFTWQAAHVVAAQTRALELATRFDIVRPDNKGDWSTAAPKAAYELGAKSEAYPALSHFLDVWMDSPVLYHQVINKDYKSVAIGYYEASGTKYCVVHFYKEAGTPLFTDGWNKILNQYYYQKSGKLLTGWQTIGSADFYFNTEADAYTGVSSPYALTGWQTIAKKTFYFKKSGAAGAMGKLYKGWQNVSGSKFYFRKNGALGKRGEMYVGFQNVSGKKYYFEKSGADGKKGKLATGWKKIGDYQYYFKTTGGNGTRGQMYTGTKKIGGKTYVFDSSGHLLA